MYLVRSGAITGFDSLARSYGVNPVQLIHDSGLSDANFRDPNSYISYSKMALLLEKCAGACGAPFFGFHLAELNAPGVLGDLPSTVSQMPTVGQALHELDRYIYLYAKGAHIIQKPRAKSVRLVMTFDFRPPGGLNQLMQLSVAHLANITSKLMGVNRYTLQLNLEQSLPAEAMPLQQGFFPQTKFKAPFNGVLLPARALNQKTLFDEDAIQLLFKERLSQLQERYPNSLQNQTRAIIGQLLPFGECCIEKVAANLDLHPRMLQLKLQHEDTSYQSLLLQTRQTIAEQYLAQGGMSITDLALNLGYSDVAVFSRSFKKWTGLSPRAWVKKFRGQA